MPQKHEDDLTRVEPSVLPAATVGSTASGNEAKSPLTSDEERDVMNFDPWGDRDATYVLLRQSFVIAKNAYQCVICFGPIASRERHWARIETDDGKIATFRFCAECCWCIAHRYDDSDTDFVDSFERMYERWEIGRKRADDRRTEATI